MHCCLVLTGWLVFGCGLASAQDLLFSDGYERALAAAPVVQVLRDDRVATLELDYDAENPWGQFWTMSGAPNDDAGFLVVWWPLEASASADSRLISRPAPPNWR